MNYSDLINRVSTNVDLGGIHLLNPYIQSVIFRYTGKNVSCFVALKDVSYETISYFFEYNEINIPKNMKKILVSIGKNPIGIDLKIVNNCVVFGFFKRHKNIDFYSSKYRESLPEDIIENGIRVTYDLQRDEARYIKFYCKSKLDPKNKTVSRYHNFGYLIDESKELVLNSRQLCTHKKPKQDSDIPAQMLNDYRTVMNAGFEVYQTVTRENSKQSYLYVKKSL
jgi:hypothetical protein